MSCDEELSGGDGILISERHEISLRLDVIGKHGPRSANVATPWKFRLPQLIRPRRRYFYESSVLSVKMAATAE